MFLRPTNVREAAQFTEPFMLKDFPGKDGNYLLCSGDIVWLLDRELFENENRPVEEETN